MAKNNNKKSKKANGGGFMAKLWTVFLVFLVFTAMYSFVVGNKAAKPEDVSLSFLSTLINQGQVADILVEGDKLSITLNDEAKTKYVSKKEREASLTETLANYGVTSEALSKADIKIKSESGFGFWILNILPVLVPIIFIVIFFWFISRQVKGQGMQAFSFGQSRAKMTDPNDKNKVTFKDVAGVKEAKQELEEIVDFLKNPKKFIDIGADIPKGVLLEGPPGTGKTLLARAVAGEANVPFFHLSGSDFVEMFVGVGASRVRDLFGMAKKAAPSIVFIDEIDAVGRKRGSGVGGGNDEREQTLNQILTEMDGFDQNQKVIVIAATNRSDVLDNALLRPGRFDRRVMVELPDRAGREEILKIHARKKPLEDSVNLKLVAERTPGFSGADLYSLMNEAAIRAAREDRKKVSQDDILLSIDKVLIGPERKSHIMNDQEKKIVAYHEAGHALVMSVLPNSDPVHKVTIVSRGRAGGYTMNLPLEERYLNNRSEFKDDIAGTLGGYVAEKMVFGDITTGPSNDLQVITRLARSMVTKWGMSDVIGPVALEGRDSEVMFGRGFGEREYSEKMSDVIDQEVKKIIDEGLKTAEKVLTEKRSVLDDMAKILIDKETLEQDEYNDFLKKHGIPLKELPQKDTKPTKTDEPINN
ncbi:MAG: cell division protease FtsH [Patescibacteria group bacterium]|jgi:cell division protease FtsH|nr:cell division protease FtsH [Patescibacteria group bacterium]